MKRWMIILILAGLPAVVLLDRCSDNRNAYDPRAPQIRYGVAQADTVGRTLRTDLKYSYLYNLTGTAPYVRFVNKKEGLVYDDTDTTDYLSATTTWTDTDVALTTKMTTVGGWLIPIPATLPDGVYDMLIYDVSTAAGARSNADTLTGGKHIIVADNIIVSMSDI
jgi:hypothetical protein